MAALPTRASHVRHSATGGALFRADHSRLPERAALSLAGKGTRLAQFFHHLYGPAAAVLRIRFAYAVRAARQSALCADDYALDLLLFRAVHSVGTVDAKGKSAGSGDRRRLRRLCQCRLSWPGFDACSARLACGGADRAHFHLRLDAILCGGAFPDGMERRGKGEPRTDRASDRTPGREPSVHHRNGARGACRLAAGASAESN